MPKQWQDCIHLFKRMMPAGRRPFKSRRAAGHWNSDNSDRVHWFSKLDNLNNMSNTGMAPAAARKDDIALSAEAFTYNRWYNAARFTLDGLHRFDISPAMMQAADEIEAYMLLYSR